MSVHLFHQLSKTNSIKYTIPCNDMEETVKSFKERFLNYFENPKYPIELVFHGKILSDSQTLAESGIESDVVIQLFVKTNSELKEQPSSSCISEEKLSQIHKFISSVRNHPHNKMASLLKMNRSDNLKKILQKVPKLQDDQRAMALLLDPFLLTMIKEEATLKKISQSHPALIDALLYIMEMLKENEKPSKHRKPGSSSALPAVSSPLADSDSESSGSDNFNFGLPTRRSNSESSSRITSNQLSAALAFANNTSTNSSPNSVPTTSSNGPTLNRSSSASVITSSMFSNALTNAMRQVRDTRSSRTSDLDNQNESGALATQLQRMREMGLSDDAINIQALVICNGDVQAAINLVLSGAIENSD